MKEGKSTNFLPEYITSTTEKITELLVVLKYCHLGEAKIIQN